MAKIDQNGKGLAFTFWHFWPFFQLLKNGLKRPKMRLGVVENDSKAVCLCFCTVFKMLKKWPKLTKMVRGKPLLFGRFWPFFQLLKNGLKRAKITLRVVENDSKAVCLCFWTVFKKLKKWPKLTKMVRGKPLLFGRFWPFFQLLKNGLKRPKITLRVFENYSKAVRLIFEPFLKSWKSGKYWKKW